MGCDLTTDGLTGFVWIQPKGIRAAPSRQQTLAVSSQKPTKTKAVTPSEPFLPLIPGFQYDIFFSYADQDDRAWIEKTLANLRKLMEVQCSDYERSLQWVEHADWTPEAQADARVSATFLIVLSQRYLASDWGKQDDAGFLHALRQHIHGGGKIFLLALDQTEPPESLCRAIIHPFTHEASVERDQSQLWQLSQDLSKELQRLLKQSEYREKLTYKGVLIDHDPVDQHLAESVAQKLKQFGVGYVFPVIVSGKPPSEVRNEFERQVWESDGLLMVYGSAAIEWLLQEVNRMRKIFVKHPHQFQAFAIYNGPPLVDKLPETFVFPGLIIDCRTCQPAEQDCEQCPHKQEFLKFVERLKEEPPHV